MSLNILKQINWLDIFALVLIARVCYVALKTGFPIELFKLLGTLCAVYFSLHYYILLSDLISKYVPVEGIPTGVLYFSVFLILAICGYLIFSLLRNVIYNLIKLEAVSNLNKWGGLILGAGRAILLTSLIIFIMVLSNIEYLKKSVKDSYSGKALYYVSVDTYAWIWSNLASKFASNENYNETIPQEEKGLKNK
ncbi:MAG: CvpA family protein [Candidatus Omnitrophica bacterium]|nr:CvpA family protein [Candidatus Omnitrophota bacterium]